MAKRAKMLAKKWEKKVSIEKFKIKSPKVLYCSKVAKKKKNPF